MALAQTKFRMDQREFTETLRVYRQYSRRDPAEICNVKSYRILRSATYKTPKATRGQIKEDLLRTGQLGAPIAALIVNKMRRAAGLPGLYGTAMKGAVNTLIKSRRIATLRAGNVQAMKDLAPFVRQAVSASLDKVAMGKRKGYGRPAREGGWTAKTEFANTGGAKWDTRDTATPKAGPAWQAAFDEERQSMQEYIERKMRETVRKAGIKTR